MHEALIPSDDVDDFFVIKLRAIASAFQRTMLRNVLNERGLPLIEWQLMFSIARFGTTHLAYITQHTSIDAAHGSRAAGSLEKKGLIERHDDPENRRRKLISLTESGKSEVLAIWPRAQSMVSNVMGDFTTADASEIKRLLVQLHAATNLLQQTNQDIETTSAQEDAPVSLSA
ncbi:MAG: winged helix-turn-helix transcriptional regulator [Rhodobacteraceae bacterium]|nr:winged helix-turn-helix transcriptional regulator [Paracoccaceae bacterium]